MNIRDAFRLISKIGGLLLLSKVLIALFIDTSMGFMGMMPELVMDLLLLIFALALIFKPDWVINAFHLQKGFEENRIDIGKMSTESLLRVAVILISFSFVANGLLMTIQAFSFNLQSQAYTSPSEQQTIIQTLLPSYGFHQFILGILMWVFRDKLLALMIGSKDESPSDS